jgi:short-subunit dehydrogenase
VKLAAAGINLVIVARKREALDELAGIIKSHNGVQVLVVDVDLGSETALKILETRTSDLDVGLLVAAAGFGTSGPFLESTLDTEMEMLSVNCRALFGTCFHFAQRFAKRGRGGIILMSSIVGFQGMPFAAHYAATKAYVQTLAEALYVELAPLGIDVLAAAPGPTHSGFAARAGQRMATALRPEDISQPILDALGLMSTTLPGFLSKVLRYSIVPLPRWARVRIMGKVMQGMTKHRGKARST